ncbi:DUF4184 family protein [Pengzhenrongella sp.]|jgi:hypothetical protein|uniref:DUF4184 family protein n=1 Tax=Pengzhenrongella sp. TaxID=2888820 RepID=UPI002F95DC5F
MPFTASHIAAVLPLTRAPLVASALVIGSMTPDLPYFVPLPVGAPMTHSLLGVVSVDVLLGLAVFVVWHGLLVRPALAAAPASLRERLSADAVRRLRSRLASLRGLLVVSVSLAVGALTHVAWDAFTHEGAWGTERVAWLIASEGAFPGYKWAQYASGVVGALVVAIWLARWWRRTAGPAVEAGLRATPELPRTGAKQPAAVAGLPRTGAELPEAATRLSTRVAAGAWLAIGLAGVVAAAVASWAPLTVRGGPYLRDAAVVAVTHGIAFAGLMTVILAASWHCAAAFRRVDRRDVAPG